MYVQASGRDSKYDGSAQLRASSRSVGRHEWNRYARSPRQFPDTVHETVQTAIIVFCTLHIYGDLVNILSKSIPYM